MSATLLLAWLNLRVDLPKRTSETYLLRLPLLKNLLTKAKSTKYWRLLNSCWLWLFFFLTLALP